MKLSFKPTFTEEKQRVHHFFRAFVQGEFTFDLKLQKMNAPAEETTKKHLEEMNNLIYFNANTELTQTCIWYLKQPFFVESIQAEPATKSIATTVLKSAYSNYGKVRSIILDDFNIHVEDSHKNKTFEQKYIYNQYDDGGFVQLIYPIWNDLDQQSIIKFIEKCHMNLTNTSESFEIRSEKLQP